MRWLSTCLEKGCFIEPRQDFSLKSSSNLKTSDQSSKSIISEVFDENINNDDRKKVDQTIKQGFVCAHSSNESLTKQNHNELITQELSKLASTYKNSNDQWRSYAYEKAIAAIKRHPAPISSREGMSVILNIIFIDQGFRLIGTQCRVIDCLYLILQKLPVFVELVTEWQTK